MEKIVSVIVPVYKTERYLKKCIDSILSQDYLFLDIILVDDGSPDKCPLICDQYAQRYINIQVIHQPNQGVGSARNIGMAVAKGCYLLFLDSDDCLDENKSISKLVEKAEEKKADIVVGNFRRINNSIVSEVNSHHLREGEYTGTVDFRFKGFYMYGHLAYNWGKLYRKSFLEQNDIKSMPYAFTQDKAYNFACCACDPVYAFIEESVVLYRVNEESITFKYKKDFISVWISIAKDFQYFVEERKLGNNYGDLIAFHIFFGIFFLVKQEIQLPGHNFMNSVKALKSYGKDPVVRENMRALAKGKYVNKVENIVWKIFIPVVSRLFCFRAYSLFTAGIMLLRKMGIDQKITKTRYKDK